MVSRLIVVQAAALSSPSAWGQRRVLATGSAVPPVPCAAPHAGPPLVPTCWMVSSGAQFVVMFYVSYDT